MRAGFFIALSVLAGCAFGSETAFFNSDDAAQPIADGARMRWTQSDTPGERFEVSFHQEPDGRYRIDNLGEEEEPMRGVLFVPIADTPEEDYVVQLRLNMEVDSVALAYMWREGESYRVVYSPSGLFADDDLSAADAYCQWQTYQGCNIRSREEVFAVYRALIYPSFVAGDLSPEAFIELTPLDGEPARPPKGRK